MGKMKDLGIEVADYVYRYGWNNEEILKILLRDPSFKNIDENWLLRQIQLVREHPEIWNANVGFGEKKPKANYNIYEDYCTCPTEVAAGLRDGPLCPYCQKQSDKKYGDDIPFEGE